MADKKQNKRNNKNYDEDYNPKFRKQRKKYVYYVVIKTLYQTIKIQNN